jgi:hypothetical protein
MSRTYELGCDTCNVCLWVGQGKDDAISVYTAEPHRRQLADFFQAHLGHPLRLLDTELVPDEWVEIGREDDIELPMFTSADQARRMGMNSIERLWVNHDEAPRLPPGDRFSWPPSRDERDLDRSARDALAAAISAQIQTFGGWWLVRPWLLVPVLLLGYSMTGYVIYKTIRAGLGY